jgi:hypothetical protein
MPTEHNGGIAKFLSDQVTTPIWHMRVEDAEDEAELGGRVRLAGEAAEEVESVLRIGWRGSEGGGRGRLCSVGTEGAAVDVRCEV